MSRKEVENILNQLLTHRLSLDQATDAIVSVLFQKKIAMLKADRDRLDSEMHKLQEECRSAVMRDVGRKL